jgi:hypothetical protein
MIGNASRIRRLSWPALAALALASSGCWRSPSERAADRIAERNAAARGGLEAWRRVRSMSMSGTLEAGKPRDPVKLARAYSRPESELRAEARRAVARGRDPSGERQVQLPFVLEMKRPRMTRLEIEFQGHKAVQVYDGKKGWKLRPFLGRHEVEPFSAEELRAASRQAELDGPLIDWADKGSTVNLLGTEQVEGRDAYELEVRSGKGEVRHVWVDAKTFLDVKVDGTRRMDGKLRPVFTYLRDYRPVGGVMIPHVMETTVEGVPGSERITVEHVTLNPDLADARFERPD